MFKEQNTSKKDFFLICGAFAWFITVVCYLQEKIDLKDVDFTDLCTCEEDMLYYEDKDIKPVRCIVQLNRHKPFTLDVFYALNLQHEQKMTEVCKFNVFIKETERDYTPSTANLLSSIPSKPLMEQSPSMRDMH